MKKFIEPFLMGIFAASIGLACSHANAAPDIGLTGNYVRLTPSTLPSICKLGDLRTTSGGNLEMCNGSNTWSAFSSSTGTVQSVALSDGSTTPIYSITGSPITGSGTLTFTLGNESANTVFSGPTTGSAAQPGFRALVGADLPAPTASTLGGVESIASQSHKWINTISTAGAPSLTQPACGDLSNAANSCSTDTTNASNISSGTLGTAEGGLGGNFGSSSGALSISSGSVTAATLSVPLGGTAATSFTAHSVLLGEGTSAVSSVGPGASGTILQGASSADPTYTATPVLGASGTTGTLGFSGTSSGTVTIQPQSAAGTYNFNLPITPGSAGQVLTSQGGGSTAMNWTSPSGGSVSSTGKNYLTAYTASTSGGTANAGNGNFELGNTAGWALGTIGTLTNGLPTGSPTFGSGASGNLSISTVTSGSQIAGSYSMSYVSSAATTQGNMVASSAFYIDAEDQGKVLTWKIYYNVNSGASSDNFSGTSSNSFGVAIYDVTNSNWLGTSSAFGMVQGSNTGYATGTFQTAVSTQQLRFVVYNVNATSGATTLYFDDISVGPQTAPFGPAVTDWVAYTPTFTGMGTVTNINFVSRRVGDSLEVIGTGTTGTSTATPGLISLGYNGANGNVSMDTSKISTTQLVGMMSTGLATSTDFTWTMLALSAAPTTVQVGFQSSTTGGNNTTNASVSLGTTTGFKVFFTVPIAGWSSNSTMSSDTDTRVVAVRLSGSSTTFNTTPPTVSWTGATYDTHGGFNGTTTYTIPVTGYYSISAYAQMAATAYSTSQRVELFYNIGAGNVSLDRIYGDGSSILLTLAGSDTVYVTAGTAVTFIIYSDASNTASPIYASIKRLSGPAVVAATESVNMRYYGPTNTAATGVSQILFYGTKVYDSHNAYNTSNGVYTVPVSGKYRVTVSIEDNGTHAASVGNSADAIIFKNGAAYSRNYNVAQTTSAISYNAQTTDVVPCNAGDTISGVFLQNFTATYTPTAGPTTGSYITIDRVGN